MIAAAVKGIRTNFTKMGQNHSDHNKDNYYYFCPIIQTIKL